VARVELSKLTRGLLLGLVLAVAALLLLPAGGIQRLDQVFYDAMLQVHERPASNEIIIIAIDEKSLRQLGKWPWSRRIHARLLERLTSVGADAVGIDILFSERDQNDPHADVLLAQAIEKNGRVVLAVGPESEDDPDLISETLPLPDLAASAERLAHVDFEVDNDGICRRVFLRAGLGNPHWPALGLALLQLHHPELASGYEPQFKKGEESGTGWVREQPLLIAYAGPPGHIRSVSYVDVLRDRVSPEVLRGRIVMIGAKAAGLGDVLSTPLSGAHTLMSGIEVNANVLATLLDGKQLVDAHGVGRTLYVALLILFFLLWLFFLPARLALVGYALSFVLTLLTSASLLYIQQAWYPPVTTLLLQTILFMAWSWLDLGQVSRLSQQLARQLHLQARRDRVTGLPNRPQLEEKLHQLLSVSVGAAAEFGLLVISMGRHRTITDLAGMKGNDEIHRQIAVRLTTGLPDKNMIYRLDGAEFAVLIKEPRDLQSVAGIAARLVQSLLRPFRIGGDQFIISPSIGAARYPHDAGDVRALIDNAYTAMHRIRRDRRRSFCFYTEELKADIGKLSVISQGLRKPEWTVGLKCVYQSQVSIQNGRLVGVETLVRWRHPEFGDIPPADFIPVAEQEGLIVPIGNWVLTQACRQGQEWRVKLGRKLRMAVNVSAVQLDTSELLNVVERVLTDSGLPADCLELELTETALLADHESTLDTLVKLKRMGVSLAIDDFGTGYSSLTYLKNFPIDRIKIDRSFIRDVHESNESAEIIRSIVAMTHGLQLKVIAEGVERREHLDYLRELGCDEAQGYLLGEPMAAAEFELSLAQKFAL
jgi:diguanylate cyclase (GGDEF)-like protein